MIKIQLMPKWRKRRAIEKIKADSLIYLEKMKIQPRDWVHLAMTASGFSHFIVSVKRVNSMPLLKITTSNRAFEISAKYRFSTYRFFAVSPNIKEASMIKNLVYTEEFGYRHRPPWKVAINTVLRFLQFWTERPIVIASKIQDDDQGKPLKIVGYKLIKAHYLSRGEKD
jgi:hypothetical protein